MKVKKAVIPAAGLGTRFLPQTKAMPKEMLNIVDRPGIQYAVEEAARSGIEDILLVTSRGKAIMEDHFDSAPELEAALETKGKEKELAEVKRITEIATVHSVRQPAPLGLGHAVLMAKDHVGDEPFAVLLPDEIVPEPLDGEVELLGEMVSAYEDKDASIVAVREVAREEVSSYGIVEPGDKDGHLVEMVGFVEKPSPGEAPSDLASVGRYVLSPNIFAVLEKTQPGAGGEVQVTDAIRVLAENEGAFAYIHDGPIFDVGRVLSYLKATVEIALRREDLAQEFRSYLADRLDRLAQR